jgi:PKD repeat protein
MKKIFTLAILWLIIFTGYAKSYSDSLWCPPWFYYYITGVTPDGDSTIVHFYADCDSFMNVAHVWHFGDSTIGYGLTPVHHFSNAHPVYQVCHEVTREQETEYYCEEVNIVQSPLYCKADFRAEENITINCNCPGVFNFYDQSAGDIESWTWDFGDSSGSSEQNPTHMYEKSGIFNVNLYIETANGCQSYFHKFIVVGQPDCDIKISYDILESFPPQYHFYANVYDPRLVFSYLPPETDSSWYNLIVYNWDFGDGKTSGDPFPTHRYDTSGEYTVCLNVKYSNGTECEACITDYFEGGQIDQCIYTGTFYKSNKMCDHDFIIDDWGQVLGIQMMIPEIALANNTRIRFGYEYSYDTLWNCYEDAESVIITCIEVLEPSCELTGTVRDYTGLDGCGFLIELDNGEILEPAIVDTPFVFRDYQRVRLSYNPLIDAVSICMVGTIAEITCIEEIGSDTIWPPPYCEEQILLNTSYTINNGGCGGSATIEFLSPCSAGIYWHMYDYSILWSTGETSQSVYGLCPNNLYLVSVTRSDGMTYNAAFSFFQLNNIIPAWSYYNDANTYYFNLPVDDGYTVEWKFDDETSVFGKDISYIFTQGGTHTVDINVWNGSGDMIYNQTIIISVVTDIKDNTWSKLRVYPLPAGDILNIEFESAAGFETVVRFYSVSGQFIYEKEAGIVSGINHLSLDISDLKSGIYLLTLETPQGILRHKINK